MDCNVGMEVIDTGDHRSFLWVKQTLGAECSMFVRETSLT